MSSETAFAQPQDIFSSAGWAVSSLTGEELVRYGKLQSNYPDSALLPISINNLANAQFEGELVVSVPGNQCGPSLFKAKHTEYISENEYFWYAELDPPDTCSCQSGHLLLHSMNGEKFGMLQMEEQYYSIEDLTGGKNILARDTTTQTSYGVCGASEEYPEFQGGEDASLSSRFVGNCDVRMLVLFTSNVSVTSQAVWATIEINRVNMALLNSTINPGHAKLVLAGTGTSDINETGMTMNAVLNLVRSSSSNGPNLRTSFDADIVVLVVNRSLLIPLTSSTTVTSGLAFVGPSNANAYAVVSQGGQNTFQHEVGHLFGGRHERCDSQDPGVGCCRIGSTPAGVGIPCGAFNDPSRGHTWSYQTGGGILCKKKTHKRKTLMYSAAGNNNEVKLYFSNPDVLLENHPTGVENERDNAMRIRDNGCTLANFLNQTSTLSVSINGATVVCENSSAYVSANVSGAPGPYQYQWYQSASATNYGSVQGTSPDFTVNPSCCNPGNTIFIKLTVTATGSGQSVSTFYQMEVLPSGHPGCFQFAPPGGKLNLRVNAYPNPSTGHIDFTMSLLEGRNTRLEIFKATGQIKDVVVEGFLEAGMHNVPFEASGYGNGFYFVRFWDGTELYWHKVVIQKN